MGGGNGKAAFVGIVVLLSQLLDAFNLTQNITGYFEDLLPGWGYPGKMLTAAGKDLHTQFVFKQAYLLTDTGL